MSTNERERERSSTTKELCKLSEEKTKTRAERYSTTLKAPRLEQPWVQIPATEKIFSVKIEIEQNKRTRVS